MCFKKLFYFLVFPITTSFLLSSCTAKPQTNKINTATPTSIPTLTPTSTPTTQNQKKFSCPKSEWIDCMPSVGPQATPKPECQDDYLQWVKKNCPNFKGVAL